MPKRIKGTRVLRVIVMEGKTEWVDRCSLGNSVDEDNPIISGPGSVKEIMSIRQDGDRIQIHGPITTGAVESLMGLLDLLDMAGDVI